jgi:hypothetical protein
MKSGHCGGIGKAARILSQALRTRVRLAAALLVASLLACGSAQPGMSETASTRAAEVVLQIHLDGEGSVAIASGSTVCPADCTRSFVSGSAVHLDARPGPGMDFTGWSGACSGNATCDLVLTQDTAVGVRFSAKMVQPTQHTLSVGIVGNGSITSTPAGIACPGRCSASFADGTAVELVATPGAQMALASWDVACAGTGSCVVRLLADASVTATFVTSDPPACAALVPSLPAARTVALPAFYSDLEYCGTATSDGDGNLYLWTDAITSTAGAHAFREGLFVPLQTGFSAFTQQMAPSGAFLAHAPDGTVLSSSPILGYMSTGGVQANGGVVSVRGDCNVTDSVHVTRIDDAARLTSKVELSGQKCLSAAQGTFIGVIVDALDRTLLVTGGENLSTTTTIPAKSMAARWFDAKGQPLTDWFDTGARPGALFPLIGGGIAVRVGDDWVATIASGTTMVGPAAAGFESRKNPVKVLGGRAYAMVPDWGVGGSIDIVDPAGTMCGTLTTVPAGTGYAIGRDGSLVHVGSRIHDAVDCSITYYPQVLK